MSKFLIAIILSLTLSACASHYGAARIVSNPPGAEVIDSDDGTLLGVTPLTVWFKEGSAIRQTKTLRIKKSGYYEKVSAFWLSMRYKSREAATETPDLVEVVLQKIGE